MAYDPKTFDWHSDALASKADATGALPYPPIYNDTPMTGTYAYKPGKKEAPKAVFFWYSAKEVGKLLCMIDGQHSKFGLDIWPACSRFPIARKVYDSVVAGNPWPHEVVIYFEDGTRDSTLTAGPGHNSGDSEADLAALKGNVDEWAQRIKLAAKKGAPQTQQDADAVADMATKLNDLLVDAEKRRKAITDPLWTAWKTEQAKWDFIKTNEPYVANAKRLAKAFLDAENARRAQAAREASEAAAAAAKAAAPAGAPAPEAPAPTFVPVAARAGTTKTLKTREVEVVKFDDFPAAAKFFCEMESPAPDIIQAVRAAALALLKAKIAVPGARLETETKV